MKNIIIVPDGMADEPLEELGGKTPLEMANTANMDHLARNGTTGLVQTIPSGFKPGSDIGNMAIMGYNPAECHTGRAPLEAANLNIDLAPDEIAFRCNLVTIHKGKMSDYSAGHIETKEASVLIDSLNKDIDLERIRFHVGRSYRHLLILKVLKPEDYMKIETVPPHDILGKDVKPHLPKGAESEMLLKLMEKAKEIFKDHPVNQVRVDLGENPANGIWLWGQGTKPTFPSFKSKFGVKGSIISAVDLVNGIGKLADLEVVYVPGITGYYDTDYLAKAEYALKALKKRSFVYIHIEAPDEAGHNGDIKQKLHSIERIDKDIVGTILNHFGEHDDVRIMVLPDHPTPVQKRTHTSDPVPFVMYGKGIAHDGSEEYGESACKAKGLKFESGEALTTEFMTKY